MRIYLTGASGFVGSNLAHVFAREHGAEVVSPGHEHVDLTDELVVRRSVLVTRPDAIVHAAIWNDPAALHTDRRRAWDAYVGATRNVVAAANAGDAHVVLISTDWVFDGTQGPAPETEPPNPINTYGFLKACSELVVTQSAARGTIARIAGVQGIHRARPHTPRAQDAGFGYLVLSLVDALRAGERFAVWDGPGLNLLATPTLATDAAELVWRALTREVTGTLHCCGGEHVDRVGLARRATRVFELDSDLLDVAPPPADVISGGRIPRDTRLDATATARSLDVELARSGRDAAKAPRPGRVIMEPGMSRLTVAQALVRFLAVQEIERDGERARFFAGCFGIFGHGNVAGLGQALAAVRRAAPVPPGAQRAGDGPHRRRIRPSANRLGDVRVHDLDRPGGDEHGHRRRARDDQPPAGAAAARRHVRYAGHPTRCCSSSRWRTTPRSSVNDCFRPVSRFFDRVRAPRAAVSRPRSRRCGC